MSVYLDVVKKALTAQCRAAKGREASTSAPPYVYASRFNPCARAMALDLTHPGDRGEFDDVALERFYRGDEIERMIVARLSTSGSFASMADSEVGSYRVVAQQRRFELKGRNGTVVIVGKTDGEVEFDDRTSIPFDVKSGAAVQHVDSLEKLMDGKWTRHMIYQILAYCYGAESPFGWLVIDKPSGPDILEVKLEDHLDKIERFLSLAENAVAHRIAVDSGTTDAILPPFIEDSTECLRCDHFKKACSPPLAFGEGLQLINDPEIHELAELVVDLRELGKKFNASDKKLKAKLRGVELASIGGDFDVVGKWGKWTSDVYPKACPKCRTKIEPKKVTDPKGRFLLTIEPSGKEADD